MAVKDANRERTRTQLLDGVAALGGAVRSIDAVKEHILAPIDDIATRYNYVEREKVQDAMEALDIAMRNVNEAVESLRDGAVLIAREE